MITERIEKAINIFLDAVNEGTLAKGDCTKCAVGNLVKSGLNLTKEEYNLDKLKTLPGGKFLNWALLFYTSDNEQWKEKNYKKVLKKYPSVKQEIESTDFTLEELIKIEYTFETNTEINHTEYSSVSEREIRADQIKGLEAVINLMMTFDDVKEDVKEVFTNKLELVE